MRSNMPIQTGVAGSSGEVEATIGLAEYFGPRLKLEQGVVFQTDGTWQAVLAWEWDFEEGR